MSFVERLLTRVFPREPMPWGTRFRMFGTPNDRMDVSRSLLKRPIPLPGRKSVYLHKMERGDMDRDHQDRKSVV